MTLNANLKTPLENARKTIYYSENSKISRKQLGICPIFLYKLQFVTKYLVTRIISANEQKLNDTIRINRNHFQWIIKPLG